MKPPKILSRLSREAIVWTMALILLGTMDTGSKYFSLCPLKNAGISICPGCGLGASVSYLLHGEVISSLQAHPLGIPAVMILLFRIVNLSKQSLKQYGKSN